MFVFTSAVCYYNTLAVCMDMLLEASTFRGSGSLCNIPGAHGQGQRRQLHRAAASHRHQWSPLFFWTPVLGSPIVRVSTSLVSVESYVWYPRRRRWRNPTNAKDRRRRERRAAETLGQPSPEGMRAKVRRERETAEAEAQRIEDAARRHAEDEDAAQQFEEVDTPRLAVEGEAQGIEEAEAQRIEEGEAPGLASEGAARRLVVEARLAARKQL